MTEKNLTMLTDFYEFTMANGYFEKGIADRRAYFDMCRTAAATPSWRAWNN